MNEPEFLRRLPFNAGDYAVEAALGATVVPLLHFSQTATDDAIERHLSTITSHPTGTPDAHSAQVANAIVRAGAPHPGLLDKALASLHREARENEHVELFVDINSLCQGLVTHLAT